MKKLLLILLFVPLVSFGQSFGDGYEEGWKAGYCHDKAYCNTPIPPLPSLGKQSYQDGYSSGFAKGTAKYNQEKSNEPSSSRSSSASGGAYAPAGSYENPDYSGVIKARANQAKANAQLQQETSQAMSNLAGSIIANVRRNSKNETLLSLKVDLNAFKYLVFNKVSPDAGKAATRKLVKQLKKELIPLGYNIINLVAKKEKDNDPIPEDLKLDPSIGLYFTLKCNDDMSGVNASLNMFDYEENLVLSRNTVGLVYGRVTKKVASEFLSDGHSYNPNIPKYLPIQLTEEDILARKEKDDLAKDEAVKRLKEAKDLFDSGILTKEEYDKLVAKYKPIIMGN